MDVLQTTDGAFTLETGGMQTIDVRIPAAARVDSVRLRIFSTYESHANSQVEINLDLGYATVAALVAQLKELITLRREQGGQMGGDYDARLDNGQMPVSFVAPGEGNG